VSADTSPPDLRALETRALETRGHDPSAHDPSAHDPSALDASTPDASDRRASPYDEVPYEGTAVPLAHPERMAIAALRAGLAPRDPSRASVLELGCAEAGNLLPLAFHLTETRFLGVDGSAVHIEAATRARDRLGLDNLALRHADFRALRDVDLGQHDYVIVHGVLSWVDEEVRGVLLDLVARHLAPQGVAYLSYNCAAGWALKLELRELLLRRTAHLSSPAEKARAARTLLASFADSPLRERSHHAGALAQIAESVLERRDAYVLHEYLEPVNHPFRQPELRALTARHGLAFVAELTSVTGRVDLESALLDALRKPEDDPAEVDELADVMLGRAFRCSVFCRAEAERRTPEQAQRALAERAAFRGRLLPEAKRPSLDEGIAESFVSVEGVKVSARSALLKAALLELARAWPGALGLPELVERCALLLELRRVEHVEARSEAAREALAQDLLELARLAHLEVRLHAPRFAREVPERPRVEALTRYEAALGASVTTPHHELLGLDPFSRILTHHLDGSRTLAELSERMRGHAERGDLILSAESGERLEGDALARAVEELVPRALETLRAAALLTA
jgi:methyltransferase-like protein/ubiquinone/menaquinone biosynthesis C-methylase UbiE